MDVLLEIVEILMKQPNEHQKLINASFSSSTQMSKLYKGICEGVVRDDHEARMHLYNSPKSTSKYYEVKRRLKSRLVDCLVIRSNHNEPSFNTQDAYYSCLKTWIAARILTLEQAQHASSKLLETVLPISQKYEFTDVTILVAQQLIAYYAVHNPSEFKYDYCSKLITASHHILAAESSAEIAYFDLLILFARSQSSISEVSVKSIRAKHDNILSKYKNVTSGRFIRMSFLYEITCAEILCQNKKAYELCLNATKSLSKKPYQAPGAQLSIDLRALANLVRLGRFEEGEEIAIAQLQLWSHHRSNWHTISFYYFVLNCHAREYTKAYKTMDNSLRHSAFINLHEHIKQLWYINQAYTHFFLQCGKVDLTEEESLQIKKFRIYKFLNEVPIYSKDKKGVNISILIIQILFFVWEKKYRQVQDRINSLNRYCKKYLTEGSTYRSHCFIKMLVQLAKADMHPLRGQRYAKNFHDKLLAMPLAKSRQAIEVEIVPYEHLWEMILEMCGTNSRKIKSAATP